MHCVIGTAADSPGASTPLLITGMHRDTATTSDWAAPAQRDAIFDEIRAAPVAHYALHYGVGRHLVGWLA